MSLLVLGKLVLWIGLAGGAVWIVDAWLYRLKERPTDGSSRGPASGLGNALLRVQTLVDPAAASAIEAREFERVEEENSGDPPS